MENPLTMAEPTSSAMYIGLESVRTKSMVTVRLSDIPIPLTLVGSTAAVKERSNSVSSNSSGETTISSATSSSSASVLVDWDELDKTEEQEPRVQGTDEATSLLLVRLEQENAALAGNPKSGLGRTTRLRRDTRPRPPSVQQLKKLVNGPQRQSLRYSQVPTPAMTELEFWAALVQDYSQTAQRLPTLTSNKIRGGVPPPLRGVVWPSIAMARDGFLHEEFARLCAERSPYEGVINKDLGRSFPNVDMFREKDGEGQQMLGRVLKSFSIYDHKIGYCQGLGFVVGPLLMHMSDAEAFSVLVRLMEDYDLRSCYMPDLSGLHLRIYQFQNLLSQHLPELAAHLEALKVEPVYLSQWFLSFFAVTCPLPMLLRIYDVILSEGATETLMRVALSLMKRNQKKLVDCAEFEEVMQFLLSRGLWDTYAQHADDMVADFVSLTGLVTREALQSLETSFKESQGLTVTPSLKSTASQLLGRFWASSAHSFSKSGEYLALALPSRPTSSIRTRQSKHSVALTIDSRGSNSDSSTLATELSYISETSDPLAVDAPVLDKANMNNQDKDLHSQIEDLLNVLKDMQRQQNDLARDLQREREEREEDREIAREVLVQLKTHAFEARELAGGEISSVELLTERIISKASRRFSTEISKRTSILQTKHQLRDAATEWKVKHDNVTSQCQDLTKQLDQHEKDHAAVKEQLKDARARIQDGQREKQRMERTIQDLRSRKNESPIDSNSPVSESFAERRMSMVRPGPAGLREFKLGRSDGAKPTFSKRASSLNMQTLLSTENQQPAPEDALLLELVNAKTAEAIAKQELEEVKGKLDALRKMVGGAVASPSPRTTGVDNSFNLLSPTTSRASGDSPKATPTSTGGGFFSGWGRKAS